MHQILNYGGGRQTVALCVLIGEGLVAQPDRIVIADTGREKPSTWEYLAEVTAPYLARIGLAVEIAPRQLAYVDLYSHQGTLLLPVFTKTGKLSAFCSNEWKARVIGRYFAQQNIAPGARTHWIGFALDEARRVKSYDGRRYPLIERMLTKENCLHIIKRAGLPVPPPSSCWMCPNMSNEEWRYIRDTYPVEFARACALDEQLREEDRLQGNDGVWLHHSRVPLVDADLDADDRRGPARQCGLGLCML